MNVFFSSREIDGLLIVHKNLNMIAFDDHVLLPPGIVGNQLLENLHEVVLKLPVRTGSVWVLST